MSPTLRVPAETAYGNILAYSRLVSRGEDAWISGCAPVRADGALVGEGSAYLQSCHCIALIGDALARAGFTLSDVVRLRIYLRSFEHVEDVARAQREAFADISPACTVIAAAGFVAPGMLVYMDADARRESPVQVS